MGIEDVGESVGFAVFVGEMAEGLELHVFDVGLGEEEDGEVDHALAFEAGVVA